MAAKSRHRKGTKTSTRLSKTAAVAKRQAARKASSAAKARTAAKSAARSSAKAANKASKARTAKTRSRAAGSTKSKTQGAKRGMIANNNKKAAAAETVAKKKTVASERTSKQAVEQARKPLSPAKPAEAAKKPAAVAKKPVAETAKKVETAKKAEVAKKVEVSKKVETAKKPAELPVAAKKAVPEAPAAKKSNQRQGFKTHEFIVYPAHGVGQILAIEEQEVAGYKLELFVISFAKDKMTLRVPTTKVAAVGMRKLAEPTLVKKSIETLKGRARIKRTMWSRRAQEYEAKINSGDIVAIAEVVRDLFRSDSQPEQSYSERQLYEAALDRLAREVAAVERLTETEAVKEIEAALAKGPRRGPKPAEGAEAEDEAFVADEAA